MITVLPPSTHCFVVSLFSFPFLLILIGKPPEKLSAGVIACIVVGVLIIPAVFIAGVYYFCWGRNRKPFCCLRKTKDRRTFNKIDIPLDYQPSQVSC